MYDYNNIDLFALACTPEFLAYPPETSTTTTTTTTTTFTPPPPARPFYAPAPPPVSLLPPELGCSEDFDAAASVQVTLKSEVGYSSSSASSYGSPAATATSLPCGFVPRSMSSNSIHQQDGFFNPVFSYPNESHSHHHNSDTWDSDTCPSLIRKVFSTGDLQRVNNSVQHGGIRRSSESPILHENCTTIEGMNKVGRYSAEERKERIERYRSKRHQRNFTKKIKYACRKTLADSRPRIRGRFARNEEIEESPQAQIWYQMGKEENDEDGDVWLNFFEAFSVNLIP